MKQKTENQTLAYDAPKADVILLRTEGIICTSGEGTGEGDIEEGGNP